MVANVGNPKDKVGLIVPDNLPQGIIDTLSYAQIRQLGYYLFEQLVKQRDFTNKRGNRR